MEENDKKPLRKKKITVLAYGEGDGEKIFLRHLVSAYCRRDRVTVSSSSAGGGDPTYILHRAIRFRRGIKRDFEFIFLDTDKTWPEEMIEQASQEGIELIGNCPSVEAFFLEILEPGQNYKNFSTGKCKALFKKYLPAGSFSEEECSKLFPKVLLNSNRERVPNLDKIIKIIEGYVEPK